MKKSELQQIIREEIRKIINEASIQDIMPVVTQFTDAAEKKYKNNLYDVRMDTIATGDIVVTAYVNISKWDVADKYWANKFTKNFGNTIPGTKILFITKPTDKLAAINITQGKSVLK